MAGNYVLLESIELTQTAANVTFDNIPQTGYTDLKIVASARSNRSGLTADGIVIRFNGDTNGSNYTARRIYAGGSGAAASDTTDSGMFANGDSSTASVYGNSEAYIPNYTISPLVKSIQIDNSTEANIAGTYLAMATTKWTGTSAITSIVLSVEVGTYWYAGSTFSIYGISASDITPVTAPKATGGNIVANDGTYWYHAFTTSGYFVPQTALTCNILQIAGGGGGGSGSGGGAGGLLAFTAQSLSTTSYSVLVGSGGVGMDTSGYYGMTNGTNSQFDSLTASVGGGTGKGYNQVGAVGGSGGGGAIDATAAGGAGTSGQGSAGGSSTTAYYSGGGGGGAGGAGGAGISTRGGLGGAGVNTYSSWATPTNTGVSGYYAGGGGGGYDWRTYTYAAAAGGAGGGGTGAYLNGNGVSGTQATGGGGGAGNVTSGSLYSTGGNGGSGLVIIRYAMV